MLRRCRHHWHVCVAIVLVLALPFIATRQYPEHKWGIVSALSTLIYGMPYHGCYRLGEHVELGVYEAPDGTWFLQHDFVCDEACATCDVTKQSSHIATVRYNRYVSHLRGVVLAPCVRTSDSCRTEWHIDPQALPKGPSPHLALIDRYRQIAERLDSGYLTPADRAFLSRGHLDWEHGLYEHDTPARNAYPRFSPDLLTPPNDTHIARFDIVLDALLMDLTFLSCCVTLVIAYTRRQALRAQQSRFARTNFTGGANRSPYERSNEV